MEELEKLRQKLYSIQKEQSAQKLSERNCIEIIVKMLELKMIDIIHTLNGKEYITPKQLELEIKDEILRSGGRVNITDLQPLLNIDISHIQDSVNKIIRKDKSIQIYHGEIMTNYYLDSVVEEIQEQLQEVGKLHINDLSIRFDLEVDLLTSAINPRLGRLIHAVFDSSETLYTQAHIDRHKHKVMGLFSSVTQPTIISHLVRQYQGGDYQLNERMAFTQLQELISAKRINGIIQGKGSSAEYIPNIFSQSRSKWIESFFTQNSYIAYDSLTKLQIHDPKAYLKQTFKNGIALSTCFIDQLVIDKVDDSITEIIENVGWLDVSPLVPPPLSNKDMEMVIKECPNMKCTPEKAIVLNEYFVVSTTFIDRCFTLLQNSIQDKVEKQQKAMENLAVSKDSIKETVINSPTTTSTSKSSAGGKKGKSKQGLPGADNDSSDEDIKPTKKGGNKKKGGKRRNDDSDDDEPTKKGGNKNQPQQQQQKKVDHLQEIIQLLSKWYESMEEELIQSLSQYLRPKVNQAWENMVKEAREKLENETMKSRKQQQQQLSTQLNSLYANYQLFKNGMEDMNDEKSTPNLTKHLLKTVCTNIANLLVEINANYHMVEFPSTIETAAQRQTILQSLPSQVSKSLDKLYSTLSKSSIDEFQDCLDTVCSNSQIKLKSLDKKSERALLDNHQKELKEQLETEQDFGNQFQIIVNLLYIKHKNHYVYAPPRSIGSLVTVICDDEDIDQELKTQLNNLHQEVVKAIINKSNSSLDQETKSILSNIKSNLLK